jgi:hypothetical protein
VPKTWKKGLGKKIEWHSLSTDHLSNRKGGRHEKIWCCRGDDSWYRRRRLHSGCVGRQHLLDAVSAVVDWRFAAKWDTYVGVMFSQVNGGLANGSLQRNNIDPTAGLRFRF